MYKYFKQPNVNLLNTCKYVLQLENYIGLTLADINISCELRLTIYVGFVTRTCYS